MISIDVDFAKGFDGGASDGGFGLPSAKGSFTGLAGFVGAD